MDPKNTNTGPTLQSNIYKLFD